MTAPRSTTLTRPADTREGMGRDDWREDALCRQVDPEAFYPVHATDPDAYDDARAICALCPVRDACLTAAMDEEGGTGPGSRYGMWGGMTPGERAKLARARTRKPQRAPHGTEAAARRHYRLGEPPCGPCRAAALKASRRRKAAS